MTERDTGENDEQLTLDDVMLSNHAGLIGEFISREEFYDGNLERIDKVQDVVGLERNYRAACYVREAYIQPELTPLERALAPLNQPMHSVTHIGNQFGTKIVPCFINPDFDLALESFRAITPYTTDEELVLLITDDQFRIMHSGLQRHLLEVDHEVRLVATERFDRETDPENFNKGRIAANDRYQFNGNETSRSLENMRDSGVELSVSPAALDSLKTANQLADDGILPVTELIKNDEFLCVNGFDGSKISLAVHDAIDHVWAFDLAERTGILSKFQVMFDSVGNPDTTDIFKREGEMLASIAFGVRYYANTEHGFKPIFHINDILKHLDDMFDAGQLSERHMEAYRIVRQLGKQPFSHEAQSLGFTYSNYLTEINEQRRKHGMIKQRDLRTKKAVGELDPGSADYLSFFVELHHQLLNPHNKHRDTLLRYHILLEEYLRAVADGKVDPEKKLTIRVQEMEDTDFSKTTLPPSRINWMNRNYGFSAMRDAII